jgi:5-amino-6-(5-phosphoribosylamino)uracil reductase
LGDLTKAGCIDEFDVAISPTLANNGQALLHANFDAPQKLKLAHVLQDEGFLFTRYLRADSGKSA